jgi:3-hydroxymyristoyl/3-hydroxydecanoyl-(acyl carrier protein) dehydratase
MLESLGQAAALLWLAQNGPLGGDAVMLAAVRGYRVSGHARPGDVLHHVVQLDQVKAGTAFASGATWSAGRCIATAETLIAVRRPGSVLHSAMETSSRGEDR